MNLTIAEIAELPLAAALLQDDDVVAHTPEWSGASPGAVAYPVRRSHLVVSTDHAHPMCAGVLSRLLGEMDGAAGSGEHRQAMRVAMLSASLRIVAGRAVRCAGRSDDVLEHACAGIAARTGLDVAIVDHEPFAVVAPPVAALVLVQLAANAERHDRASSVSIGARGSSFTMTWLGGEGQPGTSTARRRAERARWGLGFARIAADAIGAVVHPPVADEAGLRTAALEVGVNHLALPLAEIRSGVVKKATRAWDEETGQLPGSSLPQSSRPARSVAAAAARPGALVTVDGWSARAVDGRTWVAVPPDGVVDRARDVLDGVMHERAMWDAVPEPSRSRIVALAAILASMLGGDLMRVPGDVWNRRAPAVAAAYGLPMAVPRFDGIGAVDPRIALFLAAEFGERLEAVGDDMYLRVAAERRDDPLARVFLAAGDDALKLS